MDKRPQEKPVAVGDSGMLLTDLYQLVVGKPKPWYKTALSMVVQGMVYAIIILTTASILSAATGQSTLAHRVDRNAQVSVEASKALRCVASRPEQKRSFKEQRAFVAECYKEFDRLVKEVEK